MLATILAALALVLVLFSVRHQRREFNRLRGLVFSDRLDHEARRTYHKLIRKRRTADRR